jgi:hypothetical protein
MPVGCTFSIADCEFRIAEGRNPKSGIPSLAASLSIRLLALVFCSGLMPIVRAQTPEQQPSIESKLPPIRCTIAPTKEAVQWKKTPVTPISPVTNEEKSTRGDFNQRSDRQLSIPNPKPQGPKADWSDIASEKSESEIPKTERQTPKDDSGMRNAKCGIDDIQSAIQNSKLSTDAWFQISADAPESADIQEAATGPLDNDNAQIGPQPLAQVLAGLARRAQRNFVDPGIPWNETITYNFTDSDLDPWEAFTRIAQARGYRIVYSGDIVTLARSQPDPLDQVNPHTVKAEVWVWVDKTAKVGPDRPGLAIQLAAANVAPNIKPLTVRSLETGTKTEISLIDSRSEQGENTLRLTVNPVLLPNGNIQASMGIENATPSSDGHKGVSVRRTTQQTIELTATRQVIEIGGILVASGDPDAEKRSWIRRLFRKNASEKLPARMVVRLTVASVTGSGTPIHTDNPVRTPGSNSGKTGLVLAPRKDRRIPELTSIQSAKRGTP